MNSVDVTCPKCKFKYKINSDIEFKRTLPQNDLYWGVYIKILSEEFGMYPDELHEEFKKMFNAKDSKFNPGEKVGGTTTRLSKKEFIKFLDNIRIWAQTEHNIILPEGEDDEAEAKAIKD